MDVFIFLFGCSDRPGLADGNAFSDYLWVLLSQITAAEITYFISEVQNARNKFENVFYLNVFYLNIYVKLKLIICDIFCAVVLLFCQQCSVRTANT